ncbi:helix-turn-helix transcriptional regulator [Pseudonocardia acaciae]|uniref:helix-turn-helix transcriptional regulator n=1 Tax=Pseudonocardia acaciae TaxID=551276 RepID=UPI001FDF2EEF|nr:AraC family transcriptional regulator [Pseudonocardia acaciae]
MSDYLWVMVEATRIIRYRAGIPVYGYVRDPAVPPVSVLRLRPGTPHRIDRHPHSHEFPALVYIERDGGPGCPDGPLGPIHTGDLYVVAPGVTARPGDTDGVLEVAASTVFFVAEALEPGRAVPPPSWRSHPLLFPFAHGGAGGLLRLRVPADERPEWARRITDLETELTRRHDGYREAALAHLTLLLVGVARLATEVLGEPRRGNERLLAEVFDVIERRYPDRLSLREVAGAVNLTPGHLTTTVRRRTGRTVQDWITERRMTEARRLLTETELAVGEVGRQVGLPDPGYFGRVFRREHGITPRAWRRRASTGADAGASAR